MTGSPWIVGQGPRPGARLRLYCLPFAGGGTLTYRGWQAALPEAVEVAAIQLPGRERRIREPACESIDAIVAGLAAALEPALDRPFALFGHSMGALIAFELARHLQRAGRPAPARLFVSGRRAPRLAPIDEPIHALPRDAFLRELRKCNGTPDEVFDTPELLDLLLPMLRADFGVCERYVYRAAPPLTCPLSVYAGREDPDVPLTDLAPWADETRAGCREHVFDGAHFFVQTEREAVLRRLAAELREAAGSW